MAENKYRIGAYVNPETWDKITDYQKLIKSETGKKPTQGEVIDEQVKFLDMIMTYQTRIKEETGKELTQKQVVEELEKLLVKELKEK